MISAGVDFIISIEGRTPALLSPYQAGFQPNLNLIYSLTHQLLISRQAVSPLR